MGKWRNCVIADIGTVVGGATPSTKNSANYDDGHIAWITPKDLSTHEGRYIDRGERNISERGMHSCSTRLLPKNTVLFSSRAPIGYIAIASNELCTNQGFKSVVPNDDIDPLFLYYLLKYNKEKIENMGSGTTFKEVSGSTMKNINVRLPIDKKEQITIASILGALDHRIELNHTINKNLEEQAQTFFSYICSQSTKLIPFTELIDIAGGGTPKTGNIDFWNGEIPFFTPKDVGTPYAITTEKHITEMGLEHCNSALYPINTVFVTARGTIGKISISGVPMAMNQSCYALLGKGISQILVYFYARAVIRSLQHKANGAVFDTIVTRDFETENICEFDDSTIASFVEFSESIYQKILNNTIETDTLIKLRDTMLPQLLSGKLDISNIHI